MISSYRRCHAVARLLLVALLGWSFAAGAAPLQQTITLQPGWNAVYVELEPTQSDIETVFAGMPIASVWRWLPQKGGAEFIRDPAEGLQNVEGWFAWFPQPRPEAFLTNLYTISANTAYLVKLEGSASRQITITGNPRLRPARWQSDAFSLVGLPVAPSGAPTFAEFFSASPAHVGQPVYELSSSGQWQLVAAPSNRTIQSGRAYWIYTKGNSNYQGRLQVVLDQDEALEYTASLEEIRVVLRNRSGVDGTFQIERLGGNTLPMSFLNEDPETGEIGWPNLQDTLVLDAPADGDVFLTLAVLRREFSGERMEQNFAITDEHGQRVLLFAGGSTIQPRSGPSRRAKGLGDPAPVSFAGLWVGDISIDAVSEAQTGGTTPTQVGRPFVQRMLVHVDAAGQARLLKDVIQMWQQGTTQPSATNPGFNEVDESGRFVLLTDKDLIGLYSGAVVRDGTSVGLRYSTVAYDFADETLDFTGSFGPGQSMSVTAVVESDLPTNPFRHRYHPDHDNLDEQFLNSRVEAYQVIRNMQLEFTVQDPQGGNSPGWGDSTVGGVFEESITGLHKNAIFTSGKFRLRRVSAVSALNQ
jgi:hypothetical protein